MRILGRLLLLGLLLAAAGWLAHQDWSLPRMVGRGARMDARLAQARPVIVYALSASNWLEFKLRPDAAGRVRVISNAELSPASVKAMEGAAAGEPPLWRYSFSYQLLDADGRVLREQVYHHRTRLSRFRDPAQAGREFTRAFFLARDTLPADGRIMLINTAGLAGAARLRLRLNQRDPGVGTLWLRVAQRELLPRRKLAHQWQRLGEIERQRRVRGNVYGPELITEAERLKLLRYRWEPLAPLGVVGRDYVDTTLYVLHDEDSERIEDPVAPDGLLIRAGLRGMLALPPGGGSLRLKFLDLEGGPGSGEVVANWYGEERRQRSQRHLRLSATGETETLVYDEAGLLELSSVQPLVVRARLEHAGERRDITPDPLSNLIGSYRLEAGQGLDYPIAHVGRLATPLRIDVRLAVDSRSVAQAGPTVQPRLRYQLLDGHGGVSGEGLCEGLVALSDYDAILGDYQGLQRLSEPLRCYLSLSARVRGIRFSSDEAVLLTAYTRPPDLVLETRVPEDYLSYDPQHQRLPGWFVLTPPEAGRLRRQGRLQLLRLQRRPPRDDPEVSQGRYQWEDYHPQGRWAGRYLFTPRDSRLPLRLQALASVYTPIVAGREQSRRFQAPPGIGRITPRLIFLREEEGGMAVEVRVDGQRVLARPVRGRRGELVLPAMVPGRHRFEVRANARARWFINHLMQEGPSYVRRLANRVGKRPLVFDYRKRQAEEVLTGQLQMPWGDDRRHVLRVSIHGRKADRAHAATAWTFAERRFLILPDQRRRVPVLNTRTAVVDLGRRFFVPLLSDLPSGDYRVSIWLEDGSQGYLSLYRLTPGLHDTRQIFREQSMTTVQP